MSHTIDVLEEHIRELEDKIKAIELILSEQQLYGEFGTIIRIQEKLRDEG